MRLIEQLTLFAVSILTSFVLVLIIRYPDIIKCVKWIKQKRLNTLKVLKYFLLKIFKITTLLNTQKYLNTVPI